MRTPVFLPLFLLLLARCAGGQEPAETAYGESIDVQVVNLEVFVTDRNGQRVTGLKREDFQVLEDGRAAEVSNFFAEGGRRGRSWRAEAPTRDLIDDRSLGAQPRSRLLKALREEVVPQLRPQDLALVATYGGSAVQVAQGLTADKGLLLASLDRAEASAPHGGEGMDEARRLIQEIDQAHVPDGELKTNLDEIQACSLHDGIRVYSQQQYDKHPPGARGAHRLRRRPGGAARAQVAPLGRRRPVPAAGRGAVPPCSSIPGRTRSALAEALKMIRKDG